MGLHKNIELQLQNNRVTTICEEFFFCHNSSFQVCIKINILATTYKYYYYYYDTNQSMLKFPKKNLEDYQIKGIKNRPKQSAG